MNPLGDRMKAYEATSQLTLPARSPIIIRVDGNCFSSLTQSLGKFNKDFTSWMLWSAKHTALSMMNCKMLYVQSDEASFVLADWEKNDTTTWFDNNLQKLVSITASRMTYFFTQSKLFLRPALFDARAFVVPRDEVTNYFLWRSKDCLRNAISTRARQYHSQKTLHGMKSQQMIELLGDKWTSLEDKFKYGTYVTCKDGFESHVVPPSFEEINKIKTEAVPA